MKILLHGYYGFGNLGDDILLIVTYNYIIKLFPEAEIHILSNSLTNNYIYNLTSDKVSIRNYLTTDKHYDLILNGGGGVHFDYKYGSVFKLIFNSIAKSIGISISLSIIKKFKQIFKQRKISANLRIGIGLGIGTFTSSSNKYLFNMEMLNSYNHLFVRDKNSFIRATSYPHKGAITLGNDLSYLTKYWKPPVNNYNVSKNIGIVLRDWDLNNQLGFNWILECINLLNQNYSITIFSFDPNDISLKSHFGNSFSFFEYDTSNSGLKKIINKLNEQDIIITSRAHGAYLSNILWKPCVCLKIDDKLSDIQRMIPESSKLIPGSTSSTKLVEIIDEISTNIEFYISASKKECQNNTELLNSMIDECTSIIKKCLKTS